MDQVRFNKHGLLPKGNYEYTFKELRNSIFVNGPRNPEMFPAAFRKDRTTNKEKGIIKLIK